MRSAALTSPRPRREIVLPVTGVIAAGSRTPAVCNPTGRPHRDRRTAAHPGRCGPATAMVRWGTDQGSRAARVRTGAYVRQVGDDVQPGDVAVRAGAIIGPAQVGLLAAVGRRRVLVHPAASGIGDDGRRRTRRHLRTPGNGQVYDVNSYALAAAASRCRGRRHPGGHRQRRPQGTARRRRKTQPQRSGGHRQSRRGGRRELSGPCCPNSAAWR